MEEATNESSFIDVVINGKRQQIASGCTVAGLLVQLKITSRAVAVEVNQELKPRDRFEVTQLSDGDQLEIVTLVGGG